MFIVNAINCDDQAPQERNLSTTSQTNDILGSFGAFEDLNLKSINIWSLRD